MGSVSPKTEEQHLQPGPEGEDGEEMTSIMSAEQRKALQQAAKTEKESATLERDTAKPPPSDARPMAAIPRAAAVPAEAKALPEAKAEKSAQTEAAKKHAPRKDDGWATWEYVAFVLLAAAIVLALRT